MKKKILSFLLLLGVALSSFAGCNFPGAGNSSSGDSTSTGGGSTEKINYVDQVTLDMNSTATKKMEVTVKMHIDGDTTHFNVPYSFDPEDGTLKARYLAVNTPESTGRIEKWGKTASNFTKDKLTNAEKIVIETDGENWEVDSTGDRHLVWVWYKNKGSNVYRNLNIELLQEGYAVGSKALDTRYGDIAVKCISQAKALGLKVHSNDVDPNYFVGAATEVDIKELRINKDKYVGTRVGFEGIISYYSNNGVYIESFDEETQMYYAIYLYYGFNSDLDPGYEDILEVGNKVHVVGNFEKNENFGYQVCNPMYDAFDTDNPDNMRLISTGHEAANHETSAETFNGNVTIIPETEEDSEEEPTPVTYKYAELALDTSISMKNLYVTSVWTTQKGDSKGAMTLTCTVDGQTVEVRTGVLYDANGELVTQEAFLNKTIDVVGTVDYYDGNYQIAVFNMASIIVK